LDSNFNTYNFSNTIYKFQGNKTFILDPCKKKNSSSLIITNLELGFDPCVLNFFLKCLAKDPKKKRYHLIFMNFVVKKFIVRNTRKKKNFDVWMLISPRSHGMRSCNFLRLMSNKVTWRSCSYFLKILNFFWWRNGFLQLGLKLQKFVKKTEGILGVNPTFRG
jgi:hypothetical protein